MGKRNRKRGRKSLASMSDELTVGGSIYKDVNGDICDLGHPELDTGM